MTPLKLGWFPLPLGGKQSSLCASEKTKSSGGGKVLALENDLGAIQWCDHGFGHGSGESPAQQGVQRRPAGPQGLLRHHPVADKKPEISSFRRCDELLFNSRRLLKIILQTREKIRAAIRLEAKKSGYNTTLTAVSGPITQPTPPCVRARVCVHLFSPSCQ